MDISLRVRICAMEHRELITTCTYANLSEWVVLVKNHWRGYNWDLLSFHLEKSAISSLAAVHLKYTILKKNVSRTTAQFRVWKKISQLCKFNSMCTTSFRLLTVAWSWPDLKQSCCCFAGQLLDHIKNRVKFTELEASFVIRDLALALQFLHKKGTIFSFHSHHSLWCNKVPQNVHYSDIIKILNLYRII